MATSDLLPPSPPPSLPLDRRGRHRRLLVGVMSLADLADLLVEPDWMKKAACRDVDSDIFFPSHVGGQADKKARQICRTCPVQDPCLERALEWPAPTDHGIWANTNANQRKRLRQRREAAA